ncbi:hypothetical protein SLEP1_g24835 [Rubroshorea leprosula]|uniref:Uncharacterized protein n=1 Tax=Rubroshorea leprosula TaxID=152421 RepID=A0AAV5JN45_9ROSI|nr:hypothetical protein SLEP1_g24835 [Rubroshorea leprosula]
MRRILCLWLGGLSFKMLGHDEDIKHLNVENSGKGKWLTKKVTTLHL